MKAPSSSLVISFLPPQILAHCLQPEGVMNLLLQYMLVSLGDPFAYMTLFAWTSIAHHVDVAVTCQQLQQANTIMTFQYTSIGIQAVFCDG
jgi:hypothetical protein